MAGARQAQLINLTQVFFMRLVTRAASCGQRTTACRPAPSFYSAVKRLCQSEEQFSGCEAYGVVKSSGEYVLNIGNKMKKGGICFSESLQKTKLHPLKTKTTNK